MNPRTRRRVSFSTSVRQLQYFIAVFLLITGTFLTFYTQIIGQFISAAPNYPEGVGEWSQISPGDEHTCGISNGQAYCWGGNLGGVLGDGTITKRFMPAPVDTSGVLKGKTVTAISASSSTTCALADGQAYCWGYNNFGQLGNNSTTNSPVPVAVDTSGVLAGKTLTQIAANDEFVCVLGGNQIYCWGNNWAGQLGNNSTTNSPVPVAVDTSGVLAGKTITSIQVGYYHACALADARVYCWGNGDYGLVGHGSLTNTSVPVAVDTSGVLAGKSISSISSTNFNTCALADGQVYCWGANWFGELGNNSTTDSSVPVAVDTSGVLNGVLIDSIGAGNGFTCALADGQTYCWGYNQTGELGDGSQINSSVPVVASTVNTSGVSFDTLSAGNRHTCALSSGSLFCWGQNNSGQLGISGRGEIQEGGALQDVPVQSVNTQAGGSCALAQGDIYCWGNNTNGRLGNGSTSHTSTPIRVDMDGVLAGKTIQAVSLGGSHACALADGALFCWGRDNYGQLGNGAGGDSTVPVAIDTSGVLAGKTITSFGAGAYSTCVVADGQVYCWGRGYVGMLGNGSTTNQQSPVAVNTAGVLSGKTIERVYEGAFTNCVIADGEIFCWGSGNAGQLGPSVTTQSTVPIDPDPTGVLSGKTIEDVAIGVSTICALADGQVYCWGNNQYGNLGINSLEPTSSNVPVPVDTSGAWSGKTVTSLGGSHSAFCAVADGALYCWGSNQYGELGTGTTEHISTPTAVTQRSVLTGTNFTGIDTTTGHSCANTSDDKMYCWGRDQYGELGTGHLLRVLAPRAIENVFQTVSIGGTELRKLEVLPERPTFHGTAEPGSLVTVEVHSDPVSCTDTVDSEGNWSCTVNQTIPPGPHTVNVAIATPQEIDIQLGPFAMQVLGASTTPETPGAPSTGTLQVTSNQLNHTSIGLLCLLGSSMLLAVRPLAKRFARW